MKSASVALDTHIQGDATTLAQYWKIRRTDGVMFNFTSHDIDDDIDVADGDGVQTYEAETSFKRSAMVNNDELAVDNLDVQGLLKSDRISENDLRRGIFDFAEVWVFVANYESLVDGIIKMRRGWFGEVTITPNGWFKAELRGMTQVLARQRVDVYRPECPYDVGDDDCGVPISNDVLGRTTAYVVDDYVKTFSALEAIAASTLMLPLDDLTGEDTSQNAFPVNLNQGTLDTTKQTFGAGARNFTTSQRMDYSDDAAFEIGSNDFTIDFFFNPDTISATFFGLCSRYNNGSNDRVFWIGCNDTSINVFLSDDGTSTLPAMTYRPLPSGGIVAATEYHFAVTRDSGKRLRIYLDGTQINGTRTDVLTVATTTTITRTVGSFITDGMIVSGMEVEIAGFPDPANNGIFTVNGAPTATTLTLSGGTLVPEVGDGTQTIEQLFQPDVVIDTDEPFALAFVNSTTDLHYDGTIDDFRFINGCAVWDTASFTVPITARLGDPLAPLIAAAVVADYDDVIYRCTVAGITACAQPVYSTVIGDTTIDGTASFIAEPAWERAFEVTTVGVDARKNFVVTELTPNADPGSETRGRSWFDDDSLNGGVVIWETGLNAGRAMEVKDFVADDGITIEQRLILFVNMPFDITIGDTGKVYRGCDKSRATCRDIFANGDKFGGFPDIPGQSIFNYPDAKS